MRYLKWLWKQTSFGMSDEEFRACQNQNNIGPNFDNWIEKWDFDVWCIGIILLTIIVVKLWV